MVGLLRRKGVKLITQKETSVDRIPGDVTRADFTNWVEEFHAHLDNLEDWVGVSSILKNLQPEVHAARIEVDKKKISTSACGTWSSTVTC